MFNNPLTMSEAQGSVVFGDYTRKTGRDILGQNEIIDQFYTYWQEKHALGPTHPRRADIKPKDFVKQMGHVVIMDVGPSTCDGPELFLRLVGSHVETFFGQIQGKPLTAMANIAAQQRIRALAQYVIESRAPALSCTPGFDQQMSHKIAYALYMPLFDDVGEIRQIMASVLVENTSAPGM